MKIDLFGGQRFKLENVSKEFFNKYYGEDLYYELTNSNLEKMQFVIDMMKPHKAPFELENAPDISIYNRMAASLVEWYDNKYFEQKYPTKHEPNGKQTYPDHSIIHPKYGEIYIDSKCVIVKSDTGKPQYGSGLGNYETFIEKLNTDNWYTNKYAKSIISITYYDESTGNIVDTLYMPMIYMVELNRDKDDFYVNGSGTTRGVLPQLSFERDANIMSYNEKEDLVKEIIIICS